MSKRKQNDNKETNKKFKTTKSTDIDDFGKVYGWVFYNNASCWNFHSDSGCYYSTCQTEVHTVGNWSAIYQPSKDMKQYEDNKYYIIFKYKKTITEKVLNELKPKINEVENLVKESYNDILKITKNRWSTPVNGTIKEISQIVNPLELSNNSLKMCFELRGMTDKREWLSHDSWIPHRLRKWLGMEADLYSLFDDNNEIQKNITFDKNNLPEDLYVFTEPAEIAQIE